MERKIQRTGGIWISLQVNKTHREVGPGAQNDTRRTPPRGRLRPEAALLSARYYASTTLPVYACVGSPTIPTNSATPLGALRRKANGRSSRNSTRSRSMSAPVASMLTTV